jgi:hypothetical protein
MGPGMRELRGASSWLRDAFVRYLDKHRVKVTERNAAATGVPRLELCTTPRLTQNF